MGKTFTTGPSIEIVTDFQGPTSHLVQSSPENNQYLELNSGAEITHFTFKVDMKWNSPYLLSKWILLWTI